MADHRLLIPHIQQWEGGYVNDPHDLGGATNKGVTLDTYTAYCRRKGYPRPTVERLLAITDKEWAEIYKTMYWDRCKGDEIHSQSVANMLVDWYWHSGMYAIKILQRLLGVQMDGIVGAKTLHAINSRDALQLYRDLKAERIDYYHRIATARPTSRKYLRGWINRVNAIEWKE